MKTENLSDAIKGTLSTSYGRIFLISILLGPFYLIALLYLARAVLAPDDAEFFRAACSAALTFVVGGSGFTTLKSGLMKTAGKIAVQQVESAAKTGAIDGVIAQLPGGVAAVAAAIAKNEPAPGAPMGAEQSPLFP